MLLAYLDESYDKLYYLIAAVTVPGDEVASLTQALDDVAADAAARFGAIQEDGELHGAEIVGGRGGWGKVALEDRLDVYRSALDAIARHEVGILCHSMDRVAQQKLYGSRTSHPHPWVLSFLVEAVDRYAAVAQTPVLLIADDVDDSDLYRSQVRHYQQHNTGGWKPRKLTQVVDTLHFAPSNVSRLLQAADLVAFVMRRVLSKCDTDPRGKAAMDDLWDRIWPRNKHWGVWIPQGLGR